MWWKAWTPEEKICQLPHQQMSPIVNRFYFYLCIPTHTTLSPTYYVTICHHIFLHPTDLSKHGPAIIFSKQSITKSVMEMAFENKIKYLQLRQCLSTILHT